MKHEATKTTNNGMMTYTYGEHGHLQYYVTIAANKDRKMYMALWICDEETGVFCIDTQDGIFNKWGLRQATGKMMARLCEGGYHIDAIRLLADFVQDVA
jgi:hypothetical protein